MALVQIPTPRPLKEKPFSSEHRILLIGDSGTGKTRFMGTLPKPYIIDFDNGLSTLRDHPTAQFTSLGREVDGWIIFKGIVDQWLKSGPQHGAETLCVDSLTFASDACMDYVLTKSHNINGQPTIGEWGEAIREMKDILGKLSVMKAHVCVSAHATLVKDEVTGETFWQPLVVGKDLPSRLPIFFDEVYAPVVQQTLVEGKKKAVYKLQVKPDQKNRLLKSRLDKDGTKFSMFEEPDFTTLLDKTHPPL